jgi:MFS family permease
VGVANGVVSFGYLFGPAVGTLAGGFLMSYLGWRPVFILFGSLSLLWLWPWSRVVIAEPRLSEDAHGGVGVQNMCGNLAGIFAPAITGFLVNATGRFETAFWLAGLVNLLGVCRE